MSELTDHDQQQGVPPLLRQGIAYVAVGVGTALLELVLFELLLWLGVALAPANICAVCVATVVNFALNGTVAFKGSTSFARSLVLYLLLFALNTAFSTFTIGWLVDAGMASYIAKGLTMVCIVLWNFVLYRKVVFV